MRRAVIILLGMMISLLPAVACRGEDSSPELSLLAINVGKADALLLRSGESAYLIDTGTKSSADTLLTVLHREGVTRLTGVILTHTHADHTGGLKALLGSNIEVENVYASKYYVLKKEDGKHPVQKAISKADYGSDTVWLAGGDTLPLDGGSLTVIGPVEMNEETENNNSLVLLAKGGGGSILLAGDMEFPEEDSLLKAGVIPPVDVLKIGNHGESDATSRQLVVTAQPKLAVIPTDSNDEPDTPAPRVLRLLETQGIQVLVTQDAETGILVTLRDGEITTEIK